MKNTANGPTFAKVGPSVDLWKRRTIAQMENKYASSG